MWLPLGLTTCHQNGELALQPLSQEGVLASSPPSLCILGCARVAGAVFFSRVCTLEFTQGFVWVFFV